MTEFKLTQRRQTQQSSSYSRKAQTRIVKNTASLLGGIFLSETLLSGTKLIARCLCQSVVSLVLIGVFLISGPAFAVDLVKVDKSKRRMYLIEQGQVIKEYRIALGENPKGHKQQEGDNRTPEGKYVLQYYSNDSSFYRSVHISYPNRQDRQSAQQRGVSPGGEIKIHGLRDGERRPPQFVQSFDWTNGCIAITNQEMDEFLSLVKMGTDIEIEW